jgi:hypothetical protein
VPSGARFFLMPLSGANSYEAEHSPPVSAKPSVGNFYVSPEINFPNCATESHGLVSLRTRGLPDILLSMKNPGADPGIGGNVSGVNNQDSSSCGLGSSEQAATGVFSITPTSTVITPEPEPSAFVLLWIGMFALLGIRRSLRLA